MSSSTTPPDPDANLMGRRVADARKARNLTQEALAEKLDVHVNSVSKWEVGKVWPRGDTLVRLSQVLGVSIPWILGVAASEVGLPVGRYVLDQGAIDLVERAQSPESIRSLVDWDPQVVPVAFEVPERPRIVTPKEAVELSRHVDAEIVSRFPRLLKRWQRHVFEAGGAKGPKRLH